MGHGVAEWYGMRKCGWIVVIGRSGDFSKIGLVRRGGGGIGRLNVEKSGGADGSRSGDFSMVGGVNVTWYEWLGKRAGFVGAVAE